MDNRFKVLIVDDDHSIALLLSEILKLWDHNVSVLVSGKKALEYIKDNDYDLIILDLMMPDLDGIEVRNQALQLKPELEHRFVFTTGLREDHSLRLKTDNSIILEKPFKIKSVQDVIGKYKSSSAKI